MSLPIFTWVLDYSDERLGNRLVLLALAEHAHDDGSKAFPAVETLMRRTRLSERQVRNCLRSLEANGAVKNTGTTKSGTRIYMVIGPFNRGEKSAGGQNLPGAKSVSEIAPDPLVTRHGSSSSTPQVLDASHVRIKSDSTDEWYEVDVDARQGSGSCSCPARRVCKHIRRAREILGRPDAAGRQPGSVGGKRVTVAEHDLCDGILAAFNEVTGKRFAGAEWRRGIIGRIREHPDLTLAEHRAAIEFSVEHPWWKGDPSPAVVYGKGSVFDSALNSVRGSGQNADDGLDAYDR